MLLWQEKEVVCNPHPWTWEDRRCDIPLGNLLTTFTHMKWGIWNTNLQLHHKSLVSITDNCSNMFTSDSNPLLGLPILLLQQNKNFQRILIFISPNFSNSLFVGLKLIIFSLSIILHFWMQKKLLVYFEFRKEWKKRLAISNMIDSPGYVYIKEIFTWSRLLIINKGCRTCCVAQVLCWLLLKFFQVYLPQNY